jgi:hypothetical protein
MEAAAVATVLGDQAASSAVRAGANSIRRARRDPGDRTRQIKPRNEARRGPSHVGVSRVRLEQHTAVARPL